MCSGCSTALEHKGAKACEAIGSIPLWCWFFSLLSIPQWCVLKRSATLTFFLKKWMLRRVTEMAKI